MGNGSMKSRRGKARASRSPKGRASFKTKRSGMNLQITSSMDGRLSLCLLVSPKLHNTAISSEMYNK